MDDIGAGGWALLAAGAIGGVAATLLSQAVRDAVLTAVDAVAVWWWRTVAAVRRVLLAAALLALGGLAGWAVLSWIAPAWTSQ